MEEKIKFYRLNKYANPDGTPTLDIFEKSLSEINETGEKIAGKIKNKKLFLKDITDEPLFKDMYMVFELETFHETEKCLFCIFNNNNNIIFFGNMYYDDESSLQVLKEQGVYNGPCLISQHIYYNTFKAYTDYKGYIECKGMANLPWQLFKKICCDIEMFFLYNHREKKIDFSLTEMEKKMMLTIQMHDRNTNEVAEEIVDYSTNIAYGFFRNSIVWDFSIADLDQVKIEEVKNCYIPFAFVPQGISGFLFARFENMKDTIKLYEGQFFYSKEMLDSYLKENEKERDSYSGITKFPCVSFYSLLSNTPSDKELTAYYYYMFMMGIMFNSGYEEFTEESTNN